MYKYKILSEVLLKLSVLPTATPNYIESVSDILRDVFDADFCRWFIASDTETSYIFSEEEKTKLIRLYHVNNPYAGTFLIGNPKISYELENFLLESLTPVFQNINNTDRSIKELRNDMYKDDLTGVRNYKAFEERMNNQKEFNKLVFCFADVNGLGIVNNTQGHVAGDAMLIAIGQTFLKYFRNGDIFRKGGDEFLIMTEGIPEQEFRRRINEINQELKGYNYSLSYGIVYVDHTTDIETIMSQADDLMYQEKEEYRRNNKSKYEVNKLTLKM